MEHYLIPQQHNIKSTICYFVKQVSYYAIQSNVPLHSILVTGSYASWLLNPNGHHQPSWKGIPDINLYPCVECDEKSQLDLEKITSRVITEITSNSNNINILLDLHPFTFTYGHVRPSKINIQFTIRVLDLSHKERYPDYCWAGWLANYVVLYPVNSDPFQNWQIPIIKRDLNWLNHIYLALCSYGNILHMLALTKYQKQKSFIFDEAFRYIKEIAKEGIKLGLPLKLEDTYATAYSMQVIHEWRYKAVDFYKEFYNLESIKHKNKIMNELPLWF